MALTVYIVSDDKRLSRELTCFLKDRGCEVVEGGWRIINKEATFVVVISVNRGVKKEVVERIEKFMPRVVIVSNASAEMVRCIAPTKQIFVDVVYPILVGPFSEVLERVKAARMYFPTYYWVAVSEVEGLLNKIVSELFSFPVGKHELYGKLVSAREVALILNPQAEVFADTNLPNRLPRRGIVIDEPAVNVRELIGRMAYDVPQVKQEKRDFKKVRRFVLTVAVPIMLFVLTPYVLFIFSTAGVYGAYSFLKSGNFTAASASAFLAEQASEFSARMLDNLGFPMSGTVELVARTARTTDKVLAAVDYSRQFSSIVLSGEGDINSIAQSLYLELSAIYRDLAFLESSAISSMPITGLILDELKIDKYGSYVLSAARLSRELPNLLGYERPRTYMVLLQNNMELRPTGGFIGSFALLTFSKGELIDNSVYDVYSADGQLRGYIVPPKPIEEHLGEASWSLRDSNWDPDFVVSAERARWFLDKSLDREVDGVIAVNLEVAREFLAVLGPIEIPDFGGMIDSKNMYQKVQFEVENDFFPGSRKKAQYLSSLMSGILGRMKSASFEEIVKLLLVTIDLFDSRDIQVSVRAPAQRMVFAEQAWDGGIPEGNTIGVVEANLGVNKANYYVERKAKLHIDASGDSVVYEVLLSLTNKAQGLERIPEQRYKAYVRALAPGNAQFVEAYVESELPRAGREYVDVDIEDIAARQEFGVLVEVLPGETKSIVYRWRVPSLSFDADGLFNVYWWKQSGVGDYPLEVTVKMPKVGFVKIEPPMTLTPEGTYYYNTTLNSDFTVSIIWRSQL